MTYSKPEITVLGDANRVIQGAKLSNPNVEVNLNPIRPSFELED
jgi:hypothetical protein